MEDIPLGPQASGYIYVEFIFTDKQGCCLRSPVPTSCADYDNAYQLCPFDSSKYKTKLIMFVRSGGSNRKIRPLKSSVTCTVCTANDGKHFIFVCHPAFSTSLTNLKISLVSPLCENTILHCGQWLLHPNGGSDCPVHKLTKF